MAGHVLNESSNQSNDHEWAATVTFISRPVQFNKFNEIEEPAAATWFS